MNDRGTISNLDFMSSKTVCFYNHQKRSKRGTILRDLADSFSMCGIRVIYGDETERPDVYIFETTCEPTKYDGIKLIHAENLIGKKSLSHSYDNADAIVYNSNWLRQVYKNTFPTELPLWKIIPPSRSFEKPLRNDNECNVVCISKWWKRPYKRFPLIAEAFTVLNEEEEYKKAKLHVFGWYTKEDQLPHTTGLRPIVKLSKKAKRNNNIIYHQKGFQAPRELYLEQLKRSHLLIHLGVLDSGPQVVTEGFSRGIPMVVSNNMGGAEWMREIGPNCGIVVDIDEVTDSYEAISKLPLFSRKLCSNIEPATKVAAACKTILDNQEKYNYEPSRKYRLEGTLEEWFGLIKEAWRKKYTV